MQHMKEFNQRVQGNKEITDKGTMDKNEIELQILSHNLGAVCQSHPSMFTNGWMEYLQL